MVVATRAGDCQRLKSLRDGVDAVVDDLVSGAIEAIAQRHEPHGRPGVRLGLASLYELIGGQLFEDKLIIGLVIIETP